MPLHLVAAPDQDVVAAAMGDHEVVGHEAMPALDQVEHALALSDAALSHEQEPHAVDVGQRPVQRGRRRELLGEHGLHAPVELVRLERRAQHGDAEALGRRHEIGRELETLRHDHAGHLEREEPLEDSRPLRGVERREVGDFRLAEDLNAISREALEVPGEDEPRARHLAALNLPREPGARVELLELEHLAHELEKTLDRERRLLHTRASGRPRAFGVRFRCASCAWSAFPACVSAGP